MTLTALTRVVALLSVLVVLGAGAATAGHLHHEHDDVRHDCALCMAGFLSPFASVQSEPSPSPAAALLLPPGLQGPPQCTLYRAYLLARAPPLLA